MSQRGDHAERGNPDFFVRSISPHAPRSVEVNFQLCVPYGSGSRSEVHAIDNGFRSCGDRRLSQQGQKGEGKDRRNMEALHIRGVPLIPYACVRICKDTFAYTSTIKWFLCFRTWRFRNLVAVGCCCCCHQHQQKRAVFPNAPSRPPTAVTSASLTLLLAIYWSSARVICPPCSGDDRYARSSWRHASRRSERVQQS